MSNASSLPSAMRASFARPVVGDVALLKGLTWLRVGVTLLLAGIFALSVASAWSFVCPHDHGPCADRVFIPMYFRWLRDFSLSLFPPMLALTVADNLRLTTLGRTATLVMGFVVGILIAWSLHLVVDFGNPLALRYDDLLNSIPNGIISPVLNSGWIALVYFKRRRDLEIAAALHEAGLARVDLQKRTLESNLQAMQARVEPSFLLNTLRSVGDLYESDPVAADCMLDHLIAYLRAALPHMRSTSSTLGAELDLVRAYLGIRQIRAGGALFDLATDIGDEIRERPFPPMLLLPLINHAITVGCEPEEDGRTIHFAADLGDGRLRLTVYESGAGFAPEVGQLRLSILDGGADFGPNARQDGIIGVRERLMALYGENASLTLRQRDHGGTEALLEMPYESAPRSQEPRASESDASLEPHTGGHGATEAVIETPFDIVPCRSQ